MSYPMMQRRNAAQNYFYFALLLFGVLLSTVSRRLEPLYAVFPLAIALAYSRLARPTPEVTVECTVTPLRAFEGDTLTVRLTLTAATFVPPMELWHLLPQGATCPDGPARLLCIMRPGESRAFEHRVVFARRGTYTLGRLYSRIHPDTGLQPLLAEHHCDQVCSIYPRLAPLPRSIVPWRTHASFGHYIARTAGEGLEFAGIRPYTSGDRVRRIHWPTSLKRQELYVNEYHHERNADVVILIDTLAEAGLPHETTTLDIAVRAAASLAGHYLHQKDRVGLVNYGGVCTWVLPGSGHRHMHRLLQALLETRTHFSYLNKDVTLIPPRVLPSGALIFVLTSLLDTRIEAAIHDLIARAFQLVLVVISPAHVMHLPPQRAAAAERLWRLETEHRLHALRRAGIPIVLQQSEDPLDGLPATLARGTRRVR